MNEYPKMLHKNGGNLSIKINGERVYYDAIKALDKDHENELKKDGWKVGLDKALRAKSTK